jgi:uncharacterized protein (TIGR03790 family)
MKRWLLALLPLLAVAQDDPEAAARLVILANARQPESVELARFYAAQRHVPPGNIIALPMPAEESITWRQFIDQVWQPLQNELYRRGLIEGTASSLLDRFGRRRFAFTGSRISYLVVCRGVPLRLYNDPTLLAPAAPGRKVIEALNRNEGAVDSELSLLAAGNYEITGLVANPLFAQQGPTTLDGLLVVKVTRLDGPGWDDARRLVTSALEAERCGLLGRFYVDLQGPHASGDEWLRATAAQLRDLGFDGDVEDTPRNFATAARFDAPVFYFGWYAAEVNGPFRRPGFRFPPGAIALHIHSASAQTLHADNAAWCGPLVARGAAATVGNVFEPYLEYTHRPNLLLRALSQGRNFGDAAYYALPALSWQAVAIGDPLYRPFKVTLEAQLAARATLPPALAPYALVRAANLLARGGQSDEAIALLRGTGRDRIALPAALALARLLVARHDAAGVAQALQPFEDLKQAGPDDWPLVREAAGLLAAHGAVPAALRLYSWLAQQPAPAAGAREELLDEARRTAEAAGDAARAAEFSRPQVEPVGLPP